tara:strand:+ start:2289 stop:3251 length:963 start_codon:yes stop_codon:yes gene_type:complete
MNYLKRLNKKRIWLITGVAGFIGSNTADFLLKNNQVVIGIDNLKTSSLNNLRNLKKHKNFKFYKFNLEKKFDFKNKIDFCIHFAALNSVPRSFDYPSEVSKNNILSFINIILLCKKLKIKKVVYASSSSVYGNTTKKTKKEDQKLNPISPYAVSKKVNEYHADIYASKEMKIIGLRFFNIYGHNQKNDKKYSAVIPSWINSIEKNNSIKVFGSSIREFCYIDDAVRSILLACFYKIKKDHEVFNISGGKKISIKKLATKFKKVFGNKHTKILLKKSRKGDVKIARASMKKIYQYMGFKPKYSIDEGLSKIKEIINLDENN